MSEHEWASSHSLTRPKIWQKLLTLTHDLQNFGLLCSLTHAHVIFSIIYNTVPYIFYAILPKFNKYLLKICRQLYTVVFHFYAAHFYAGFDEQFQNLSSNNE